MRIITVNIPHTYLRAIDKLTGRQGLFPSRSELIRVAVREFLINELKIVEPIKQALQNQSIAPEPPKPIDESLFVQVPINAAHAEGITEYKTYRLVNKS